MIVSILNTIIYWLIVTVFIVTTLGYIVASGCTANAVIDAALG